MPKRSRTTREFLEALAPHLLGELRPPVELSRFTRNPAVVGAYVESAVRDLIVRFVAPLRVCTGAVIDQSNKPFDPRLPQVDTIVWAPSPVPAVFAAGEFAMVPLSSSFGVLEVKSSAYDIAKLDKRLAPGLLRRLVAARLQGEPKPVLGMGVVCVRLANQSARKLARMRNAGSVVVLFDQVGNRYVPRVKDIYRLVNFLAAVRLRARFHQGLVNINLEALM
jgi:hypothetical protein